jgi:hypothetical protein
MTGRILIGMFLAFMIGMFLYGTIKDTRFNDRCHNTHDGHVIDSGGTHGLCIDPTGRIVDSR